MLMYYNLRLRQPKDVVVSQVRPEIRKNIKFDKMITWIEIIKFNADQERKDLIRQLGIKLNSTWHEIIQANDKLDKPIQSYPG